MPGSNPRGRSSGLGPGRPGFTSPPIRWATPTRVSGVTKDSSGAVLGGCTVILYQTSTDLVLNETVSDITTGEYIFDVSPSYGAFYLTAFNPNDPATVAGVTLNTITAV